MLLMHASVLLDDDFTQVNVRLADGCVRAVGAELTPAAGEAVLDLAGDYLLPGFVDVHIHGYMGCDTMQGEAAVRAMSANLYEAGVAAFLPTTMSADADETRRAIQGIRAVMNAPEQRGARLLGAHMEAPFLNAAKAGAQRPECLCSPDWEDFLSMTGGDVSAVRLLTLAPELPGADAFIPQAVEAGITISLGHSAATAEQAHHAADLGASHVTHTFNAQPPLHHREPGLTGAALTDDRLFAECIADGVHLHGDVVRLLCRAKGAQRAVAITDAMEAAGMPEGAYTLGGQAVTVKRGQARLQNGTLAGSVLTMKQALWNLIHRFGIAPADAVRMCTATPAQSVGEKVCGHMVAGSPAPLTRWSGDWQFVSIIE
ncbi:MAG: N-acetylglucosamine-6-phosphate deacetylase [Clostridiales bacterium]|nr:N-acetylglucosamine-6-phosphate deacetylase [Clostridiales bacterium]